jgi:hypothetical protein
MTCHLAGMAAATSLLLGVALVGAHAQKSKEAWEYFKEPAFKSAYIKALGPKSKTGWLAKRDGPAPEDKFVAVGGERYAMNAFCAQHACKENSAVTKESRSHLSAEGRQAMMLDMQGRKQEASAISAKMSESEQSAFMKGGMAVLQTCVGMAMAR